MKWRGNKRPPTPNLLIVTTLAAGALTIFVLAGCGHKSADDSLAAGDLALQNGKLADAESDYQQALDIDPHNAAAHTGLGKIFESQSELSRAEEQYRAAVAIDPVNSNYRINLAALLQKQGKLGESEAHLRAAIGLDDKNAHAHLALARLLSGDPARSAEAQEEFAQVKALDPSLLPSLVPAATPTPETPPPLPVESPEASPSPTPAPAAAAPQPKLRELNRKFLLTHDSPVYDTPQESGNVVAQVHRRKFVRVTGIVGKWLRIQLKNGTVGYIPTSAAE